MTWLLLDVLFYVVAAGLLGGAIGWWLRAGAERRRAAAFEVERRRFEDGQEFAERTRLETAAALARREFDWAAERDALLADAAAAKAAAAEKAAEAKALAEAKPALDEKAAAQAARIAALETERGELQRRMAGADQRQREIEQRLSDADARARDTAAKLAAAEQANAAALNVFAAQEEKFADHSPAEMRSMELRLAEAETALQRAHAELAAARQARAQAEQAHLETDAILRQAAARAGADMAALRKELAAGNEERERGRARQDQAMQALLAGEKLLLAADERLQRIGAAERATAELKERVVRAERERDAALSRAAAAEAKVPEADALVRVSAALAGDLAAARLRITSLEADLAAGAPAPRAAGLPPPPAPLDADYMTRAAHNAASGLGAQGAPPRPAVSAGRHDDLRRIRGIGPFNQESLHALGIYNFAQIAALTEENIAWLDDYLGFKGRIEREDWVGQARRLLAGKGRSAAE